MSSDHYNPKGVLVSSPSFPKAPSISWFSHTSRPSSPYLCTHACHRSTYPPAPLPPRAPTRLRRPLRAVARPPSPPRASARHHTSGATTSPPSAPTRVHLHPSRSCSHPPSSPDRLSPLAHDRCRPLRASLRIRPSEPRPHTIPFLRFNPIILLPRSRETAREHIPHCPYS